MEEATCKNERAKQLRRERDARNREKLNAYAREYQRRPSQKEKQKIYYEKNKEKILARSREKNLFYKQMKNNEPVLV